MSLACERSFVVVVAAICSSCSLSPRHFIGRSDCGVVFKA